MPIEQAFKAVSASSRVPPHSAGFAKVRSGSAGSSVVPCPGSAQTRAWPCLRRRLEPAHIRTTRTWLEIPLALAPSAEELAAEFHL